MALSIIQLAFVKHKESVEDFRKQFAVLVRKDTMEELRLPWNDKEGLLYGSIIACITSYIMAFINNARVNGLSGSTAVETLICLPFVWIVVMLLMSFIVGKVANRIVDKYSAPSDSVNSKIALNIIACVTMMSALMSAIGPIIGTAVSGHVSFDELANWPVNWPINFFCAFWVEMIIAQPAARYVMKRKHIKFLKAKNAGGAADE